MALLAAALVALAAPSPVAGQATVQTALGMLQAQDFEGAAAELERVTAAEPENGRALSMLGFAYRQLQRTEDAITAYRRAAALPNAAPGVGFNLGLLLALSGEKDEGFDLLLQVKASNSFDLTQIDAVPGAETLRDDPRYRTLFPSEAEFRDPFLEPTRIIHEWAGEAIGDQFGWIARNIGDVDGDHIDDVTTSAPTHANGGPAAGRVYVYSGRSGALLWTADGAPGDQLGLGINPARDVNGDGIPDVIAGAPGADKALVWSGRDGTLLLTLEGREAGESFGRRVVGLGDVDDDGYGDVVVGAPANNAAGQGAGRAYVMSGRSRETLAVLSGEQAGDAFGSAVGGRTSPDGRMTLVIGAPNAGDGDRGAAYVYQDLSGSPAFVIDSDGQDAALGLMFVSAVGDVDGDGVMDVYASDFSSNPNGAGSGRVYVHSGATGKRILDLAGHASGEGFGIGIADAGDVDGDGHADLLVGAWQHAGAAASGGKLYLHSGLDGSVMREITGKVMGETLGFDTTGMGDVDGDGFVDFLVTSAWSAINGGRSGRMFIISGAPR